MPVYKTFFKILKKRLVSLIIYLTVFMAILMCFAKLSSNSAESEYVQYSCKLAIFDKDGSKESERFVEYLTKTNNIVELENDESVLLDALYYLNVDYVLFIEDGFSENNSMTHMQRPGSKATYMDSLISSYCNSMTTLMDSGYSLDEAYAITLEAISQDEVVELKDENKSVQTPTYYFLLFLPYIILMMCFEVAPAISAFNKKELYDRTTISTIKGRSRSLQLLAGQITIGIIIWLLLMLLGVILYGDSCFKGSMAIALLNSFVFTILAMSFTSIFGYMNLTAQKLSMLSNVFGLSFSFLGGVFVSLNMMSSKILAVSRFIPTYWYVVTNQKIFEDANMSDILPSIGVQGLFILLFIATSMLVGRRRRSSRVS